jgi:hypothetical protein
MRFRAKLLLLFCSGSSQANSFFRAALRAHAPQTRFNLSRVGSPIPQA